MVGMTIPMLPAKLPLLRPKRGRWLTGVCKGVALHLGMPVALVRLLFLLSAFAFGAGIVAYVFLWVFVPVGDPVAAAMAPGTAPVGQAPLSRGNRRTATAGRARVPATGMSYAPAAANGRPTPAADADATADGTTAGSESLLDALRRAPKPALVALAGLALLGIGLALTYSGFPNEIMLPLMLAVAGVALAWLRYDAERGQLPTMIGGIALIFGGFAVYAMNLASRFGMGMLDTIVSGFVMLACAALAIVPWAGSMIRGLTTERALKEREEERADMTAHLHDGVLQTLALIQLHAEEPDTVFALSRQQERELREWLYQTRAASDRSVSAGLKDIAAHVEDEHGKPIEVVTVGDARPSAQTDAMLDATGQALVNAVTHGGEPISVYCEAGERMVEIFVRDHGDGFDVERIPADRLGIRESIIGRVRRRGGTVEIVSRPGWGTEVRMHMPVGGAAADPGSQTSENAN